RLVRTYANKANSALWTDRSGAYRFSHGFVGGFVWGGDRSGLRMPCGRLESDLSPGPEPGQKTTKREGHTWQNAYSVTTEADAGAASASSSCPFSSVR